MIRTFRCRNTEALFSGHRTPRFQSIERAALRKLEMLNAATQLRQLTAVAGNRLEALKGDRQGQHSIRITDRFRICFMWRAGDAHNVEIPHYH